MLGFLHRDVNIIEAGWLRGMSDIHCHLLPGVDDGVADIEESLELMHLMRECGICCVSFSPHVFSLYPNNNSTTLRERFDTVKPIYQEEGMPCFLGGEYMIDEHFEERIAEPLLHIGTSDRLLVETSFAAPAYNFIEHLFLPFTYGAVPVVAHPERFLFLSMEEYDKIKHNGCLFQLNLFSLCGMYGESVRKRATQLLKEGYYDYVGTDMHKPEVLRKFVPRAVMPRSFERPIRTLIEANDTLFS